MRARPAAPEDAAAIARTYNQGIEERIATFETRVRTAAEIRSWFGGRHPVVVVEEDNKIVAFAATSDYRPAGATRASRSSPSTPTVGRADGARAGWRWGP